MVAFLCMKFKSESREWCCLSVRLAFLLFLHVSTWGFLLCMKLGRGRGFRLWALHVRFSFCMKFENESRGRDFRLWALHVRFSLCMKFENKSHRRGFRLRTLHIRFFLCMKFEGDSQEGCFCLWVYCELAYLRNMRALKCFFAFLSVSLHTSAVCFFFFS